MHDTKAFVKPCGFLLSLESPEVRRKREGLATCAGDQELAAAFPLAPGGQAEADAGVRGLEPATALGSAFHGLPRRRESQAALRLQAPEPAGREQRGARPRGPAKFPGGRCAPTDEGWAQPAPRRGRPRPASFPMAEPKACGCCSSRRSRTLS